MALLIITMHSIAIYILSHVFLSPKKVITFVITLYPVSFSLKITKVNLEAKIYTDIRRSKEKISKCSITS